MENIQKETIKYLVGHDVLGFPIYHYHQLTWKLDETPKIIFKNTDNKLPSHYIMNKLYNSKHGTQKPD